MRQPNTIQHLATQCLLYALKSGEVNLTLGNSIESLVLFIKNDTQTIVHTFAITISSVKIQTGKLNETLDQNTVSLSFCYKIAEAFNS